MVANTSHRKTSVLEALPRCSLQRTRNIIRCKWTPTTMTARTRRQTLPPSSCGSFGERSQPNPSHLTASLVQRVEFSAFLRTPSALVTDKPSYPTSAQAYSCTLKLPMPGKTPRLFRSSPVYATKRSATRALAEYAIQCGILSEAGRSMDNLDKTTDPSTLAGPSRGPFDGSNNPRFARPGDADIHQNAVTLLNFAVQVRESFSSKAVLK